MHAEGPGAVREEREDDDDRGRAGLSEQLVEPDVLHEHVHEAEVQQQAAALDDEPAHRGQRVADVLAEGPAAVEQEAVDGPDGEADRGGRDVPEAEALQQQRVDGEGQQRVRDADDPELHELRDERLGIGGLIER